MATPAGQAFQLSQKCQLAVAGYNAFTAVAVGANFLTNPQASWREDGFDIGVHTIAAVYHGCKGCGIPVSREAETAVTMLEASRITQIIILNQDETSDIPPFLQRIDLFNHVLNVIGHPIGEWVVNKTRDWIWGASVKNMLNQKKPY